jgi:hypothetical protein
MGIPCASLGISGREDCVDKHKGTNDLGGQPSAFAVSSGELVGTATVPVVVSALECLHQPTSTYGPQALSYHVQNGSDQRNLPSQEQPECHRRVNVPSCSVWYNY